MMGRSITFLLMFIIILSAPVFAVDYLVGAKASYVVWRPMLKDMGKDLPWMGWEYFGNGKGFMYGGNAGVILTDEISISVSYLYGDLFSNFDKRWTAPEGGPSGNLNEYDQTAKAEITRHDLDTAVSYGLNSSFKLFAGFKYQPVTIKVKQSGARWGLSGGGDSVSKSMITIEENNYAPALGIGYSLPLTDSIAFMINLSFLYLWGTVDVDSHNENYTAKVGGTIDKYPSTGGGPSDMTIKFDNKGYGFNVEPSFLFIMKDNIMILLGARVQYVNSTIKFKSTSNSSSEGIPAEMKNLKDIVYGGSVAINIRPI
jgi:hypothetical protein